MTERTPAQRAALRAYKQTAPIGTGPSRADDKADAADLEATVIQAVHEWVFANNRACQLCHGARRGECVTEDHMHEDPSRAQTRGLPPWERFNIRICGRLCQACHVDVTEHRLRIVFVDEARRFLGPVRSVPW